MFRDGLIDGVEINKLNSYKDNRGWLISLFRQDELENDILPVMSYISMTKPGVARGPHEHVRQVDYFCFVGPSSFKVFLWDNRKGSPSYMNRHIFVSGKENPSAVIVPAGVVHAYKNVGDVDGLVLNFPNALYRGPGGNGSVDEIRYENNHDSIFKVD